ncbi:MAG: RnfABCDGE type electron transport complex subunit D [Pseudomonadota bacterium]
MKRLLIEPRYYQIAALSGIAIYGVLALALPITVLQVLATLTGGLLAQWLGDRLVHSRSFDPRSALISIISLCLLLRTADPLIAALAASLAIASKFVLTWRGKHVFNPTNFALLVCVVAFEGAWIAPAQWGNTMLFGLALAGVGLIVVTRASRIDVTAAFLGCYAAALLARAWWLGDPLPVALHPLTNGAVWLFAFFMISDPRSTPDSRLGRLLFACAAAGVTMYMQFWWYSPNALIYGLASAAVLTPFLDYLVPGSRFQWPGRASELAHQRQSGAVPGLVSLVQSKVRLG